MIRPDVGIIAEENSFRNDQRRERCTSMITAVPPRIAVNFLVGREMRQHLPGSIEEGIERMRRVGLGSVTRASRTLARLKL